MRAGVHIHMQCALNKINKIHLPVFCSNVFVIHVLVNNEKCMTKFHT